jgi:membrane-associated phospholipid phosphatase
MLTLLLLATLGAYSRIYLSQHFLSDVCMGSIIGFVTPFLVFYFGQKKLLKIKNKGEKVES